MKTAIQNFEYQGKLVEFDFGNQNIMVNATEMAKIFNKDVKDFNKLESTNSLINICLNGEFSSPLGVNKKTDLLFSKPRTGTWMHRVLALKFAAWLDPSFELWVYVTIDKILFGTMREDALIKSKIDIEKEELINELSNDPKYQRLIELEGEGKKMAGKILKQQRHQLLLFAESNEN